MPRKVSPKRKVRKTSPKRKVRKTSPKRKVRKTSPKRKRLNPPRAGRRGSSRGGSSRGGSSRGGSSRGGSSRGGSSRGGSSRGGSSRGGWPEELTNFDGEVRVSENKDGPWRRAGPLKSLAYIRYPGPSRNKYTVFVSEWYTQGIPLHIKIKDDETGEELYIRALTP